jgi:hypothetical protein
MESPEHRANILNCALRDTAVGVVEAPDDPTYGIYWTQLFATRSSQWSNRTPAGGGKQPNLSV